MSIDNYEAVKTPAEKMGEITLQEISKANSYEEILGLLAAELSGAEENGTEGTSTAFRFPSGKLQDIRDTSYNVQNLIDAIKVGKSWEYIEDVTLSQGPVPPAIVEKIKALSENAS